MTRIFSFCIIGIFGCVVPLIASPQSEQGNVQKNFGEGFAVVELFTSQGCSSCPPADDVLAQLGESNEDRPIYVIGWHVDYWDYLGWKDPYASSAHSNRQRQYARNLGSNVYTPQMIVNGSYIVSPARNYDRAVGRINSVLRQPAHAAVEIVSIEHNDQSIEVSYKIETASLGARLGLVVVERNLVDEVQRGENAGRTLRHYNSARVAEWRNFAQNEGTAALRLPPDLDKENAGLIALVQEQGTMKIIGSIYTDL